MKTLLFRCLVPFALVILLGCGGGGGGDSFVGAGNITIKVSPNEVDTGDRTLVTVTFDELHPDGVAIKLRYPSGLNYIPDTSFWKIGGEELDASPFVEVSADISQSLYLVYFLDRSILGEKNSGSLTFELRAVDQTSENSEIEADVDVLEEDPTFSADAAEFSAEDTAPLRVR